jgi:hypothetical protein
MLGDRQALKLARHGDRGCPQAWQLVEPVRTPAMLCLSLRCSCERGHRLRRTDGGMNHGTSATIVTFVAMLVGMVPTMMNEAYQTICDIYLERFNRASRGASSCDASQQSTPAALAARSIFSYQSQARLGRRAAGYSKKPTFHSWLC